MAAFAGAFAEAAEGQWHAATPLGKCAYLNMDWKQRFATQGRLEELERELLEVNGNAERLARSFSELVELQLVLEKASGFFDDAQHRASSAAFQDCARRLWQYVLNPACGPHTPCVQH